MPDLVVRVAQFGDRSAADRLDAGNHIALMQPALRGILGDIMDRDTLVDQTGGIVGQARRLRLLPPAKRQTRAILRRDAMVDRIATESTASLSANQLRLWFASLAYVLMTALRRMALQGTELAKATAGTFRLKLLKLGALVTVSVRRVKIAIASASPMNSCSRMLTGDYVSPPETARSSSLSKIHCGGANTPALEDRRISRAS